MKKTILFLFALLPFLGISQSHSLNTDGEVVYLVENGDTTRAFPVNSLSWRYKETGSELYLWSYGNSVYKGKADSLAINGTTATASKLVWLANSGNVVNYVPIDATSTDQTLVAAVSGKKIRVVSLVLTSNADSAFRFESGTGGTALTGVIPVYSNVTGALASGQQAFVLPYAKEGWFETAAGELLNLEKGTGNLFGVLGYVLIN